MELVDTAPAGPHPLPFDGPVAIPVVQEWPRLAAALLQASPYLAPDIAVIRFAATLRALVMEPSVTEGALLQCGELAAEFLASGQKEERAGGGSGPSAKLAALYEGLVNPGTYATQQRWQEFVGDPRMTVVTGELLLWFCTMADDRQHHPLQVLDIAALHFALGFQLRQDPDQELLMQIVGVPLDAFHDALGYGAWLQRNAIVAVRERFGLATVLASIFRIRPVLISYLAARLQLDRNARSILAQALRAASRRGRNPDPTSSTAVVKWLLRPPANPGR